VVGATRSDRLATAGGPSAARRLGGVANAVALRLAVLAGFLVVWQLVTTASGSIFFPTPVEIVERLWQTVFGGQGTPILDHLVPSVARLLGGWTIGSLAGIAVGLAVGASGRLRDYLDPLIHFGRAIPPPALLPLFLVLLGLGDGMKVAMIAFGIVWPVLLNTIDGVQSVDSQYLDTGRVYGATRADRLLRIMLPAAAPKIFAGLRISLSIAVILMVISEMVAATNGVGFLLIQSQRTFRMLDMWAWILLLGILGYVLNTALLVVERRVLRWHQGARRGADT
jgi:ABC-type nitrate/sulfonate/bicarbonate transport system permease component